MAQAARLEDAGRGLNEREGRGREVSRRERLLDSGDKGKGKRGGRKKKKGEEKA